MVPEALGVLFVVGAVGYIVDVFVTFLVPDLSSTVHSVLAVPGVVAELWMVGYLLLIGVKARSTAVSTSPSPHGGGVVHDQHA